MKSLLTEDEATVLISEFWENIYPNLYFIPIERKGAIYTNAKKKAMKAFKITKVSQ